MEINEKEKPFEFDWSVPPIVGEIPIGDEDESILAYTDKNGNIMYEGANGKMYYSKLDAMYCDKIENSKRK